MSTEIDRRKQGAEVLNQERRKRTEYILPKSGDRIVSYHPFESMQIIFFDISSSELPDLWKLGFRKGGIGRYLRTLICKQGECEFIVNSVKGKLSAGHTMMDYSVGDDEQFTFTCDSFVGVEIYMQVDTLVEESVMLKMLRLVIEAMHLPEEEIFDSDGYVFPYSKSTGQSLDKLLNAGLGGTDGVVILAQTIEIGHSLGVDLQKRGKGKMLSDMKADEALIAEDIYRALTNDIGTKHTAGEFAEKYGVSDTTVKKYFKKAFGYGFKEYQTKARMDWAADKLVNSSMKVGEIAEKAGYLSQSKFTNIFKKHFGVKPLQYRKEKRSGI